MSEASKPTNSSSSHSQHEENLSPFEVMLRSAPPDYLTNLEGAIHLEEDPPMRKAEVIGYALAKWGDYPALIDGEQGQIISGYAYQVQSEGKAQKLMYYETNAYKAAPVWIYFRDGDDDDDTTTKVPGKGFIYAGDPKALLEQRFDRKLWALQMGDKLG